MSHFDMSMSYFDTYMVLSIGNFDACMVFPYMSYFHTSTLSMSHLTLIWSYQ